MPVGWPKQGRARVAEVVSQIASLETGRVVAWPRAVRRESKDPRIHESGADARRARRGSRAPRISKACLAPPRRADPVCAETKAPGRLPDCRRHGSRRGAAALAVRQAEAEARSPAPRSSTRPGRSWMQQARRAGSRLLGLAPDRSRDSSSRIRCVLCAVSGIARHESPDLAAKCQLVVETNCARECTVWNNTHCSQQSQQEIRLLQGKLESHLHGPRKPRRSGGPFLARPTLPSGMSDRLLSP
jgi:hypothetical protein